MTGRCKLCGNRFEAGDRGVHCQCGQHLHDGCYDDHRDWCASRGTERWIGAVEF